MKHTHEYTASFIWVLTEIRKHFFYVYTVRESMLIYRIRHTLAPLYIFWGLKRAANIFILTIRHTSVYKYYACKTRIKIKFSTARIRGTKLNDCI